MGEQRDNTIRILIKGTDFEENWHQPIGQLTTDPLLGFLLLRRARLTTICEFRAGLAAEWQRRSTP